MKIADTSFKFHVKIYITSIVKFGSQINFNHSFGGLLSHKLSVWEYYTRILKILSWMSKIMSSFAKYRQ